MEKFLHYSGETMAKLNLIIRDDLDTKFREEVFKRKGMKKGNLTEAIEEAIQLWLTQKTTIKVSSQAV